MLFVSTTGFSGRFDPDPGAPGGLAAFKKRVDSCISDLPLGASNDTNASIFVTCSQALAESMAAIEKVDFIDDADNAIIFNIVRSLLVEWRNTNLGAIPGGGEVGIRRLAAKKLSEDPVANSVSPTLAVQTLSSAGRIERDEGVILNILVGLGLLLSSHDIPDSVRTEAITTIKTIADPLSGFLAGTQVTAQEVLKVAQAPKQGKPIDIDLGPAVVTPIPSPSKLVGPIIAAVALAAVTTGVIWYAVRHPPTAARFSDADLVRRRPKARRRRR